MLKFAHGICVFALAASAVWAQTTPAPPAPLALVTRTSGMVGIAEGQIAQLNALNPGVAAPAMGVVCTGLLSFVGEDGTVLKSATVSVAPGTAAHISIDAVKDLALAVAERKQIRATITIPPVLPPSTSASGSTPPVTPACRLIGTLEILNGLDGHTQVTLGVVHRIPSPVATPGS